MCTTSTPWLQYVGNVVKMSVTSVDGDQLLAGQRLVIQPPSTTGFRPRFWPSCLWTGSRKVSTTRMHRCFPPVQTEVATFMEALSGSSNNYLSTQAVVITLGSDLFSRRSLLRWWWTTLSADPEQNYWRLMVLDAEGKTLHTNERSWTGFPLSGTFSRLKGPPRLRQPARL